MPASGQSPRLDFLPDLIKIDIVAMIIQDDYRDDTTADTADLKVKTIFHLFLLALRLACSLKLPHTFHKSLNIADFSCLGK